MDDGGIPEVVPGGLGWIIDEDPPGEWVVDWDGAGTECIPESQLEKSGERNESDPYKRLPGDPFGKQT